MMKATARTKQYCVMYARLARLVTTAGPKLERPWHLMREFPSTRKEEEGDDKSTERVPTDVSVIAKLGSLYLWHTTCTT